MLNLESCATFAFIYLVILSVETHLTKSFQTEEKGQCFRAGFDL